MILVLTSDRAFSGAAKHRVSVRRQSRVELHYAF
jgi:hypothetical protein